MWNPYLGIHMLSFARFVFTAALLVWSVSSGQADGGPKDLWSLYLREHSASLCGRGLSEEEETELDEAQHRARLRASLSLSEAAHLYRRAREAAHSARGTLCSSGDELPRELHRHQRPVDARTLAQAGTPPKTRAGGASICNVCECNFPAGPALTGP